MYQTIPQAAEYFKRKIDFVKGNLSKLEEQVNQRQNQRKSMYILDIDLNLYPLGQSFANTQIVLYNVLQQKMLEAKSQESGNAVAAN